MLTNQIDLVISELDGILRNEGSVRFQIINTWRCQLRCTHCNVGELLEHNIFKPEAHFDPKDLTAFLNKMPGKNKSALIVGGEPTFDYDWLEQVLDAVHAAGIKDVELSTNLISVPDERIPLLQRFSTIGVSLDGLEKDHDAKRGHGTFKATYKNIRKLILAGVPRLVAKGLIPEGTDEFYIRCYANVLAYVGIENGNIKLYREGPGHIKKEMNPDFLKLTKEMNAHPLPCCCFRYMHNFCITPEGNLWTGFYTAHDEKFSLGNIQSSLEEIQERYKSAIGHAPFIKDSACSSCSAVKWCWGLYCYDKFRYDRDPSPSHICNKELMISKKPS